MLSREQWIGVSFAVVGTVLLVVLILFGDGTIGSVNSRRRPTPHVNVPVNGTKRNPKINNRSYMQIVGPYDEFQKYVADTAARYNKEMEQRISLVPCVERKYEVKGAGSGEQLINNIVYINLAKSTERNEEILSEIQRMDFDADVYRFDAVATPGNGAKGCYLSHMHCLAFASTLPGNTLILEDDFVFAASKASTLAHLAEADRATAGRWDVIVFGQYVYDWQPLSLGDEVKVFRLFHSTTTSGYLVNKHYVNDLLIKWHQAFEPISTKSKFRHNDNCDQIQGAFQQVDMWIGFERALGAQREGQSLIGNVHAHNTWTCNATYDQWTDSKGTTSSIRLRPIWTQRRIAVCFVATRAYTQYFEMVATSCAKRFLKGHKLDFFVFTNKPASIPESVLGCPVHVYPADGDKFPGPSLLRYHYMLQAEEDLKQMTHVFYMDVDYWVCNAPEEAELLVGGYVGTAHLHNLNKPSHPFHKGSPCTDPASTSFVGPEEAMDFYFGGGFQGGSAEDFLAACKVLRANIQSDLDKEVMATWHDESHWNRFLLDHAPASVLNQGHIYPEQCLSRQSESGDQNCVNLRAAELVPKMVAIQKDHQAARSGV